SAEDISPWTRGRSSPTNSLQRASSTGPSCSAREPRMKGFEPMIRGVFLGAVFVFAFSTVIGLSFLLAGRAARDDSRLRRRFGSLVTGEGRSVQAQQEGAILREEFLVRRQGRIRKALRLCFSGLGD